MNILVFNCGSSSLKYKLITIPEEKEIAGGEAQRVGPPTAEPSRILHRVNGEETTHIVEMRDHGSAFDEVMKILSKDPKMIPDAIGHRMVHGGSIFKGHARLSETVISDLESIQDMAPIHNPPAISLAKATQSRYPDLPQVVVFDTAYHSTIPEYASDYALPEKLRIDMGIRKYGFHGTSHNYVASEAAKFLDIPFEKLNAVSCHLGSGGASLCAIKNGKSIDNTMGYSPLQGLVMSTRCGDLDPAIALKLLSKSNGDYKAVENLLNKQSGVLGLTGSTADIRDVLSELSNEEEFNEQMNLTAQVYLWRIRKYLGAYLTVVGNAKAVIFTDTIGETVPEVRKLVCSNMETFGLVMDNNKNRNVDYMPVDVAARESLVRILIIQTNEELAIARQTYDIVKKAA